ncbi:hypothetical protein BASA50_008859 [Batrachochytrium salamandrivorans]|uniref:Uncharacterized protein n=1 Tax=Batrachochytrium salamandrivorans TaxID=1357716 RepID=A0ABQ8F2Y9_9FUNG|nr:hypothetical protein BASA60_009419 [Batrachochytrium salamandrivorans]KAH6567526.1 hypothetical protein BASA62_006059 [Batrachochytrium salamandrivorans]KAH6591196.1 hypothetical protein BASA50_008859 [Batrachochytrium salamandrivorans]
MKLISFAVISLLAITVSAQKPTRPSTADDAPQSDQKLIRDKLQELTAAHPEQQKLILKLGGLEEMEEKELEARLQMEGLESILERNYLLGDEKSKTKTLYATAKNDWKKANDALMFKQKQLKEATDKRDGMEIKISILEENIEQKTEQDAHNRDQTKASPGSRSYREILQNQIDVAFRDADDLFAANKAINEGIYRIGDVIHRAEESKKNPTRKLRDNFREPHQRLTGMMKSTQGQCVYTRELQVELGWQTLSSRVGGMYWSLLQRF